MKKIIILSLALLVFSLTAVYAAPVVDDSHITQTLNDNLVFSDLMFEEQIQEIDGGTFNSIVVKALPAPETGMLEYNEAPLDIDVDIPRASIEALVFKPAQDYIGVTSFQYQIFNGTTYSNTAKFEIEYINAVTENTAPVADNQVLPTPKNEPLAVVLTATDAEGDNLVFTIMEEPVHGTISGDNIANGLLIYTPEENYEGLDSFKFKAYDGNLDSNIATISITVGEVAVTPPPAPTFVYEDLKTHWANQSAAHMAERGLIIGEKVYNKYYFYPETKIVRWEFFSYLLGAMEIDIDSADISKTDKFEDAKNLPEYIKKVAALATEAHLMDGVSDGGKLYIAPYSSLTRAEAIKILNNFIDKNIKSEDKLTFLDKHDIPSWALQEVINMFNYGIVEGYPDNTLKPNEILTKAQSIQLLYQTVKYNAKEPETARRIKRIIAQ